MSYNSPSRNKRKEKKKKKAKKKKKKKEREEKTYFFKSSGNTLSKRAIRLPTANSSYVNDFVAERNYSLSFPQFHFKKHFLYLYFFITYQYIIQCLGKF